MGERRAILFIGGSLLLVFGLGALMLGGAPIEKLLQRRWEPTPCVIESTSLVSVSGRSSSGKDRGSPSGLRLDVAYRYERDGRRYTGSDWSRFDAGFGTKEELQARAAGLPAGHRMTCYVHPDDPARAVLYLERVTALDIALLAAGILAVVAVLVWTAWAYRKAR